jgi:hypothetical protein
MATRKRVKRTKNFDLGLSSHPDTKSKRQEGWQKPEGSTHQPGVGDDVVDGHFHWTPHDGYHCVVRYHPLSLRDNNTCKYTDNSQVSLSIAERQHLQIHRQHSGITLSLRDNNTCKYTDNIQVSLCHWDNNTCKYTDNIQVSLCRWETTTPANTQTTFRYHPLSLRDNNTCKYTDNIQVSPSVVERQQHLQIHRQHSGITLCRWETTTPANTQTTSHMSFTCTIFFTL